jgi:hypothetical protein
MSGSWNAHDQYKARVAACLGTYSPHRYSVRVDDDHVRWKYRIAAQALGMREESSFLVWCAEYVIQHNRRLKEVRRSIRLVERELRKRRRREQLAEKRAKREALKSWKG